MTCSAQAQRMRFLETLDLLSDSERRNLLRIETTDEIAALYTVAINDFGDDSAAAHTLASVLHMRIEQEKQNASGELPPPTMPENTPASYGG